jgi:hypothetical protein
MPKLGTIITAKVRPTGGVDALIWIEGETHLYTERNQLQCEKYTVLSRSFRVLSFALWFGTDYGGQQS